MLLVFLLMQWMPVDARVAVADALDARYSWQAVQTRVESEWTITVQMPVYRRPPMTLQQPGEWLEYDELGRYAMTTDLSATAKIAVTEPANGADDSPQPATETLGPAPAMAVLMVSGGLSSEAAMLARLARFNEPPANVTGTDGGGINFPPPGNPNGPGVLGNRNGPGGGVGRPIPEPTSLPLLALAIPLLLRRKRH